MTDSTNPFTSMHEEALKAVRTSQAQAVETMRQYSKVLSTILPGRDRVIGGNESLQTMLSRQHEAIESSHDFARQVLQLEVDFAHEVAAMLDKMYPKSTSGSDRATPAPFSAFPMPPAALTSMMPAFAHLPWTPAMDTVAKGAEAARGPQDAVSTMASAQRQGSEAAKKAAQAQASLTVQMAGTAVEVAQATSDAATKMADEANRAVAPTSRSDTAGAEGRRQASTTGKSKSPAAKKPAPTTSRSKSPAAKKPAPTRSTKQPTAPKSSVSADKRTGTASKPSAASPEKPAAADKKPAPADKLTGTASKPSAASPAEKPAPADNEHAPKDA